MRVIVPPVPADGATATALETAPWERSHQREEADPSPSAPGGAQVMPTDVSRAPAIAEDA